MARLVDEAEHLSHNQNTSVASLRLLFGFVGIATYGSPPPRPPDSIGPTVMRPLALLPLALLLASCRPMVL
ncbi:MAG: hypothetical protein K7J47_14600 [Acidobacteria bacterium]|nr:hypothetical protein [Bryobacteraceae bacterium CoA2 C42]